MKTFRVTGMYKNMNQRLVVPMSIRADHVVNVERIPEEAPNWADGQLTRISFVGGQDVAVAEEFETVCERWDAALSESSL